MRAAAILIVLCACDWSLHRMQDQHRAGELIPPDDIVSYEDTPQIPQVTRELLERGGDRFERMCAPCHGVEGDGDSDVARAMLRRTPPSLVDDAARRLPDDRILFVIANGYGFMPSYGSALTPSDRYAVMHFVRALQLRDVAADELPAGQEAL